MHSLNLKSLLLALGLIMGLSESSYAEIKGYTPLSPRMSAPLNLVDLKEVPFSLEALKGKFVILNFWETYCPYCIEEFPSLETLAKKFQDKVAVVAVSSNLKTKSAVQAIIRQEYLKTINFYITSNNTKETKTFYNVLSLPTTYILNPQGEVIGMIEEALQWDTLGTFDFIQHLIDDWQSSLRSQNRP